MTQFANTPAMTDSTSGEQKVKRYVHQPLTIEHYGLHAKIQENGKVKITGIPVKTSEGVLEYDEVEIPASLVFKLANSLKLTRQVKYVTITEASTKGLSPAESE